MKRTILFCAILYMIFVTNVFSNNYTLDGKNLKYIYGCECDLNADGEKDIIIYIETEGKYLLLALLKKNNEYKTFILSSSNKLAKIECRYGPVIEQLNKKENKFKYGWKGGAGPYIAAVYSESLVESYCWNGSNFEEFQMNYSTMFGYYGEPLNYIIGFEHDLNADGKRDIVFQYFVEKHYLTLALLKQKDNYSVYLISKSIYKGFLECNFSKTLTFSTSDKKGIAKTLNIPGPYISIIYAESSSVIYYWDKEKFHEVWTSD
jgi:hypothetical protein